MNYITKSNKSLEEKIQSLAGLDGTKPYTTTTNGVSITVWPEFVDTKFNNLGDLYIWAYHVIIENKSTKDFKLINRYWKIIDENGQVQEVSGEGVIGQQPTIKIGDSYKYSSGIHLNCPSGIMTGNYQMKDVDGKLFETKIPTFSLDTPGNEEIIN